jgi:hypothetical protein
LYFGHFKKHCYNARIKYVVLHLIKFYMPLLCRNNNTIKKSKMRIGVKLIISELY